MASAAAVMGGDELGPGAFGGSGFIADAACAATELGVAFFATAAEPIL